MRDTFPQAAAEVLPLVPATRAPYRRPRRARQPLPDASAVRSVAVPDAAPPFDDAIPAAPATARSATADRVPLRESGNATGPDPTLPVARTPAGGPWTGGPWTGGPWPSQFAQALAETLAGARPAQQLKPWTSEQARRRISQLGTVLAADLRPRVRRVVLCSPAHDVLEMAVVVGFGQRTRAVAVRLEQAGPEPGAAEIAAGGPPQARWRCTAVDVA